MGREEGATWRSPSAGGRIRSTTQEGKVKGCGRPPTQKIKWEAYKRLYHTPRWDAWERTPPTGTGKAKREVWIDGRDGFMDDGLRSPEPLRLGVGGLRREGDQFSHQFILFNLRRSGARAFPNAKSRSSGIGGGFCFFSLRLTWNHGSPDLGGKIKKQKKPTNHDCNRRFLDFFSLQKSGRSYAVCTEMLIESIKRNLDRMN